MDEPVFFRFNNDLGGQWTSIDPENSRGRADYAESATLNNTSYSLENLHTEIAQNTTTRSGRSSHIAYFTNKEVKPISDVNGVLKKPAKSYSKRMDIENGSFVDRMLAPQGIGEISVFNQQGERYTYALPVYSQNEHTMQYGALGLKPNDIDQNYLVYNKDKHTKVGEERLSPYASTFLLTEVVTPDYVDRDLNGPTVDDFGGYTKFNYKRTYGGTDWFKWRMPYRGLSYQANTLSDRIDDASTASDGEKQIYYLQSVVTKTHAAIFITTPRKDGLSAEKNEEIAISSRSAKGKEKMEKLVRVELYALLDVDEDANGNVSAKPTARPIKTVHFDYYEQGTELCKSLPNAESASDGKLTLKRVWFEYNGVKTGVKISPYVFDYAYPSNYNAYPLKYRAGGKDDLTKGYTFSEGAQNPNYSPFMLDAWGNYQYNGAERFSKMQPWLNQNPSKTDMEAFDPAAWQLKRITLPSGGEIHVQYEQDDYAYVQNKVAHAMVRLAGAEPGPGNLNTFIIDVGCDISLPSTTAERNADLDAMVALIKKVYITNSPRQKIYYKMLYSLFGQNPAITDCMSEYITGYCELTRVKISDYTKGQIEITLKQEGGKINPELPMSVCTDFVTSQRSGRLAKDSDCNPAADGIGDPFNPKAGQVVKNLVNFITFKFKRNVCLYLNPSLSYFKIPILTKKGGGVRVKRLLMLDYQDAGKATPSSEGPALYGNEYIYQALDKETGTYRTSGVATNEPGSIREENALVEDIARKGQSKVAKILFGLDRKHSEGPIGESIYPGPSVGYSCVIVRNIHSGITTPGYSVKEFNTAREFPVIVKQTEINSINKYAIAPYGLFNSFVNNIYMTQGFCIILNDMHGKPSSIATYPGIYSAATLSEKPVATSKQTYTYYDPRTAEQVPVIDQLGGGISMKNPGKEVDITFANRAVKDHALDGNIEFDTGLMFFFIPIPFMTFMPSLTKSQLEIYTHTTSKVIRYPAIVKSATVTQDGITHISHNVAFDRYTGEAVAVKSYDEFVRGKNVATNVINEPGGYLSQSVMAPWQYPQMGSKALRDGITKVANANGIGEISFRNNRLYFQGSTPEVGACIADFTSGDLLEITAGGTQYYYHAGKIALGNSIRLYPYPGGAVLNNADAVTSVRVVQSGRTNQLKVAAGSYNFHHTNGNLLSLLTTAPKAPAVNNTNLVKALNDALSELKALNPTEGKQGELTSMKGKTFEHLNIAEFSNFLKPEWKVNANDATLSEMVVHYKEAEGEAILKIVAFKVNGQYTVKID